MYTPSLAEYRMYTPSLAEYRMYTTSLAEYRMYTTSLAEYRMYTTSLCISGGGLLCSHFLTGESTCHQRSRQNCQHSLQHVALSSLLGRKYIVDCHWRLVRKLDGAISGIT